MNKLKHPPWNEMVALRTRTYHDHGVARDKGEDVGAGDGAVARRLDCGLDLVDDLEPPGGVLVRVRPLLARDLAAAVQQERRVASLHNATRIAS
jgi:hypothetical protein